MDCWYLCIYFPGRLLLYILYIQSLPQDVIQGNRRWHFPSNSVRSVGAVGEAHCHHYQQPQFSCRSTIPLLLSLTFVVKPSAPTLMFYRAAGRTDSLLTQLIPAASVEKDALHVLALSINQMLLCEVVICYLILRLWWSKSKCFLPPRWTQLQFRRCFFLRTNHSSARTMLDLVSSALHSPLSHPNRPCTLKHTVCSEAVFFTPSAACCVHTVLCWQIARQLSCYFRYSNWNILKTKQLFLRGRKTAWASGIGRQAVVLPAQSRSLFTAWPGAQGCLAE